MARQKSDSRPSGFGRIWAEAGPTSRLLAGTLLVIAIGLVGLTPKSVFGTELIWPYAALIAAMGWGRSGLAFRPMIVLMLLGVVQDVTAYAPLGCFGFINLTAFGMSALIHYHFDRDRSPIITTLSPILVYAAGFALVWLFASFNSNHMVQLSPLVSAYAVTYALHIVIAPVFDLGRRAGTMAGTLS